MIECNWPTCGCQNVHGAPWCKASTVVQPSPALSALAMRERAAEICCKHSYSNNQYVSIRMIDAADRRGMQKAIETIDANISPCHAPGLWADDERHAYLRGQIDASVSFIHSIQLSSAKIGGAE